MSPFPQTPMSIPIPPYWSPCLLYSSSNSTHSTAHSPTHSTSSSLSSLSPHILQIAVVFAVDWEGVSGLLVAMQSVVQHSAEPQRLVFHVALVDVSKDTLLSFLDCFSLSFQQVSPSLSLPPSLLPSFSLSLPLSPSSLKLKITQHTHTLTPSVTARHCGGDL